jgi:hypothetical protein
VIRVTIEDSQREFSSRTTIDEAWINQQIERRRRETGQDPCVRVHVDLGSMDVTFASAACSGQGGGSRPLRPLESSLFALWQELELGGRALVGGRLIEFLKRAFSWSSFRSPTVAWRCTP